MGKTCVECASSAIKDIGCRSRQCKRLNKETGEPIDSFKSCELQRSVPWPIDFMQGLCGKRGRFFTEKPSTEEE